ncbi:MAG: hypothetical protein AAGG50_04350 [Bacteroidota bacterium]
MRTALSLCAALLFSACSLVDSPSSDTVTIAGVTVESIPDVRPNGEDWDPSSGPDVYVELQDALGRVYLAAAASDAASFPARTDAPTVQLSDLEREYFVYAVERDEDQPSGSWPWIGATPSFSFDDVADERPTTLRLSEEGSDFCVILSLVWE